MGHGNSAGGEGGWWWCAPSARRPWCGWEGGSSDVDAGGGGSGRGAQVPVLIIRGGSPRERGVRHGRERRGAIRRALAFYLGLFRKVGWTDNEIRAAMAAVAHCVASKFPHYHEEIEGIAEGSCRERWEIYALNARTELLNARRMGTSSEAVDGECSSLYAPNSAVLAQNWDWEKTMEDLYFLQYIQYDDGRRIATITEPGILAKIGLNSDGVGVLLNLLSHNPMNKEWGGKSRSKFTGCIPVHVLLRCILDSRSLDQAVKNVKDCKLSVPSMSNLFVGDDKGNYAMIELGGIKGVDPIIPPPRKSRENNSWKDWEGKLLPAHTNHFLRCELADLKTGNASSYSRQQRLEHLVRKAGPDMSVSQVKSILGDRKGDLPILRPYTPYPQLGFDNAGTCCAVVMELKTRTLHVTSGSPISHSYETFRLSSL